MSVYVEGHTYGRLIEAGRQHGKPRFAVIGPSRILKQLDNDLKDFDPDGPAVGFLDQVHKGLVVPDHYQVIIGQPDVENTNNQLVQVRPQSSVTRELYIADDCARERALWFDADSTDFRIDLEYGRRKQRVRKWNIVRRARRLIFSRWNSYPVN